MPTELTLTVLRKYRKCRGINKPAEKPVVIIIDDLQEMNDERSNQGRKSNLSKV